MSFVRFKLKKADASTRHADFLENPSWGDLASAITRLFQVPQEHVGVAFIDKDKNTFSLANELELQGFYDSLDHSPEVIKFIVQDLMAPDATIASTWSKDSNLSDLSQSDDKFKLFCWILRKSQKAFPINIGKSETVGDLVVAIQKQKEHILVGVDTDNFDIWKLSSPIPSAEIDAKLGNVQTMEGILGCIKLDPFNRLLEHFSLPLDKHLHIVVQLSHNASRKRFGLSPMEEDNCVTKERIAEPVIEKMWTVHGAIRETDTVGCYYLDPGPQSESRRCLDAVSKRQFALLWGARACGKTTRLFWLGKMLMAMGYQALYISFEAIQCNDDIGAFWKSFSRAATAAAATSHLGLPQDSLIQVSSRPEFLELFLGDAWPQSVVLLLDELSELEVAQPHIRDDCLRTFLEIRNNNQMYAIRSIIAAGTFSIMNLRTSKISPFNVGDGVQNPYFTVEEVRKLFHEFAQDNYITIDDAIVEDIWAKSNGHPALVCLCGRTIFKNLKSLLDCDLRNVSHRNWQQFPAQKLYNEISAYNTFGSMLISLARPEAADAVNLLRSTFVGFLDVVKVDHYAEQELADLLTSEGALLKPDSVESYYCMASPLLDGLIRNTLIPRQFPNSPSSVPPLEDGGKGPHVLGILIESLKFFDKNLIRLAASRSYKTSKVKIHGVPDGRVPRESVYDTELMRILSNWLRGYSWTVTSQWHLQTHMKKHKYSDIVIKRNDDPTVVLEILATGDASFVRSHIQKTPQYMALLSAKEAWVVHFTCERDYHPIWQSDAELLGGINVVHFAHDLDFTNVVMSTRWKDRAGNIQYEDRRLTV